MLRKSIATLIAVLMIASVSVVSAFAVTPGEYYDAYVESTVSFPQHTLDFLIEPAVVTNSGTTSTVTIELENPASVTVFGQTVYGQIVDAYIDPDYAEDYSADVIGGNLVVTGPASVSAADFEPIIIFEIVRADGEIHQDASAILHLVAAE
jgi:hypothetical protein